MVGDRPGLWESNQTPGGNANIFDELPGEETKINALNGPPQ